MNRQRHYWIVARDETGQPYLLYGGLTEEIARQKGFEMLGGIDFEIKMYPTVDRNAASAMHRGKRLQAGEGLHRSSERLGHEKSLRRLRNSFNN